MLIHLSLLPVNNAVGFSWCDPPDQDTIWSRDCEPWRKDRFWDSLHTCGLDRFTPAASGSSAHLNKHKSLCIQTLHAVHGYQL